MHLSEEVRLLSARLKAADDKAEARLAQVRNHGEGARLVQLWPGNV